MLITNQHPLNKSIMAAVLGAPNAGKSSLINYLLGFDLTAVTPRPQTTRNTFHCIFTVDRTEVILLDTPGIHNTTQELNKRMNQEAIEGGEGADINLFLLDMSRNPFDQFKVLTEKLHDTLKETWIVFTKSDIITNVENYPAEKIFNELKLRVPSLEKFFVLSSLSGDNVHLLTGALCDRAPNAPHLYSNGSLSNKNERFFVSEYIREQAFLILREELPYEMAVVIDGFKDFRKVPKKKTEEVYEGVSATAAPAPAPVQEEVYEGRGLANVLAHIDATIIVNKPSQRAIVVGKGGTVIRDIGTNSRKKIEAMIGGKVFLNLHVKVVPKWFRNNIYLEQIGLLRAMDSKRVWRKR